MRPLYLTFKPMLYMYFTRHRDYSDNVIGLSAGEMSKLTPPCIGPLSQLVYDFRCHWDMVVLVANDLRPSHYIFTLLRIEKVNWDATFRGMQT